MVALFFAEQRPPKRRVAADAALQRVAAHAGHDLDGIRLSIVLKIQFNLVEQADLVRRRRVLDHAGVFIMRSR